MATAIDGDAPGNSREPRLRIVDLVELRTVPQHAHERFLRSILGVVMAAEHRVGDAIHQAGMISDESLKDFFSSALARCQSAQDRVSCHHSSALYHEDRLSADFVQEFLDGERSKGGYLRSGVTEELSC